MPEQTKNTQRIIFGERTSVENTNGQFLLATGKTTPGLGLRRDRRMSENLQKETGDDLEAD